MTAGLEIFEFWIRIRPCPIAPEKIKYIMIRIHYNLPESCTEDQNIVLFDYSTVYLTLAAGAIFSKRKIPKVLFVNEVFEKVLIFSGHEISEQ